MGQQIKTRLKVATIVNDKIEITEYFEESVQSINAEKRTAVVGGKEYKNIVELKIETEDLIKFKEPKLVETDTRGQYVAILTEIYSHEKMMEVYLEDEEEAFKKINKLTEKLQKFSAIVRKEIKF